MVISLDRKMKKYKVVDFVAQHNHPLQPQEYVNMIRSHRRISEAHDSLVMPETFHGLCTWHIRQNALRHVNHLYQKNSQFNSDFEACIDLHEEEGEFLKAWDSLLVEHNVLEGSWLHMIFQLKEKWAWTYVRKTFTAGMRSTQLSESFNADLKNYLKSDLNLVQFFTHFKMVVNGKREVIRRWTLKGLSMAQLFTHFKRVVNGS
jgi:hypothetical protein